jgi:hypothetical protein
MTWETVPFRGRSITVSWRKPGGIGAKFQLSITIGSGACDAMGLRQGQRVVVQRDRVGGKMRLLVAPDDGTPGARRPTWKRSKNAVVAVVFVPMPDVRLDNKKPAQHVAHDVAPGELTLRLPHWACPLVRISHPESLATQAASP